MADHGARPPASRPPTTLPVHLQVDFKALASRDAEFGALWRKKSGLLDHKDPETLPILTAAVLRDSFSLSFSLPQGRLCPPVPNRASYVSWVQRLIDSSPPAGWPPAVRGEFDPSRGVRGLDIGTGASAIYTLLLLSSRPAWTMLASETDPTSAASAAHNLSTNNFSARATLISPSSPEDPLIPTSHLDPADTLDFTICNPPFFESEQEMRDSLSGAKKSAAQNSVCTGSASEMVCPGGDLAFVTRIFNESLVHRKRVRWYTSMFGKLSSTLAFLGTIKKERITNFAVGCLDQGVTKRWVVGWSFYDIKPSDEVARPKDSGIGDTYLPFPSVHRIPADGSGSDGKPNSTKKEGGGKGDLAKAVRVVDEKLKSLDVTWVWDEDAQIGRGSCDGNVWNRQYRRQKRKHDIEDEQQESRKRAEVEQNELVDKVNRLEISPPEEVFANLFAPAQAVSSNTFTNTADTDTDGDAMVCDNEPTSSTTFTHIENPTSATSTQPQDITMQDELPTAFDSTQDTAPVALAFEVHTDDQDIIVHWTRGLDTLLWESFFAMLHREVKAKCGLPPTAAAAAAAGPARKKKKATGARRR